MQLSYILSRLLGQAALRILELSFFFFQIEYNKKKKEEGKKARMDKDKVKDLLFNAFERHQYYTFKDLVGITQQPTVSTDLFVSLIVNCWVLDFH